VIRTSTPSSIQVQNDTGLDVARELNAESQITERRTPLALSAGEAHSIAPPTLSWPPREPSAPVPVRGRPLPSPPALMPPRGDDPSLAPLPPQPAMPDFKRNKPRSFGRREFGMIALFLLLGALGALIAWESTPAASVEIWSTPHGARVRIDGAWQAGSTPMRVSGLRQGKSYRLRLELPHHHPYDGKLVIRGASGRENISLAPR
jgi:hypothetical protein